MAYDALKPSPAAKSVCAEAFGISAPLDMESAVKGAVTIADFDQPISFSFNYGEIPILGKIIPNGGAFDLSVKAIVGYIPYSIENRKARATLLAAANNLHRLTNGGIFLDGHQGIVVAGEKRVEPPLTAVAVITSLVSLMVQLRPIFKAIGEFLPDITNALPAKIQH